MKKINRRTFKLVRNITIVAFLLAIILIILKIAPNYKNTEITDRPNLIVNNNNITEKLDNIILIKNGVIYISRTDVTEFFDPYLFYDKNEKRIITTSDTEIASFIINDNNIIVNGENFTLQSPAIIEKDTIYIPFSLINSIYNTELTYIEHTNTITVDTLSREKITATANKNISVKSRTKTLSRTVDKIKKDDNVIVISKLNNGWIKIRTSNGKMGYVKETDLDNIIIARQKQEKQPAFNGKVNMVWDNFYVSAPDRTGTTIPGINVVSPTFFELVRLGKGETKEIMGDAGINYIKWAKSNNYKIWARVYNGSMIQTTSEIMNSYELRSILIENILNYVKTYSLDGINIDFEYMYDKDKDLFSQFLVELYPRLKKMNVVLSVDVIAPDGGENWSTCYDIHKIANTCDYIVFMAYDQYAGTSTKAGTTSGYNWIRLNVAEKFINREKNDPKKIILGLPFYTRKWEETYEGKLTNYNKDNQNIVDMKNISKAIPEGIEPNWLNDEKQFYIEYTSDDLRYKMWIEDENSMKAKLSLISEFDLGGVAFWAKDREPASIWPIIAEELQKAEELSKIKAANQQEENE